MATGAPAARPVVMGSRATHTVMTGATGFIGRALMLALQQRGHRITALVRDIDRARGRLGADCSLVRIDDDDALQRAIDGADGVVNLAGEPILQRWTRRARARIRHSRIGVTQRVVDAMRRASSPPGVLVSASAVGLYGDRSGTELTEAAAPGSGFAAQLCADWEAQAREAEALGTRVAIARIGVVLGEDGGMVASLAPFAAWGLAPILGTGRQHTPVIHLHDLVEQLATALEDDQWRGPFNAVAPIPTTNGELTTVLARRVGRGRPWLRIPGALLRLGAGGMARVALDDQRVVPAAALRWGFRYRYPDVHAMVAALWGDSVAIERAEGLPSSEGYLEGQRPQYQLRSATVVDAPPEEVFDFFSRPENLGVMTPGSLEFDIRETSPLPLRPGSRFRYRIGVHGVGMGWTTRIDAFAAPRRFVDVQLAGPYRYWHHEHRFAPTGDGRTRIEDVVWYMPKGGPLGRVAHRLFVGRDLRRIFSFRERAMRLRFGTTVRESGAASG